ncbi:hypothetical protein [Parvibaculum sp.]|uniref:hypothetical protein n=1 Tax=Parvibaculum sp. TaxID=2024848 RepID=UPI001DE47AAE|nr:hypothetical protein [Parvibaculum sp.]MBX3488858.1 hypothetical protein [Parvibaculum sp.]
MTLKLPPGLPALTGAARADAAGLCEALMRAGLRAELGACGPDAFDCWSMARLIETHLFGRAMAEVDATAAPLKGMAARAMQAAGQWRERGSMERPGHGDGVLLTTPAARPHVGVFLDLDRGVVAHMDEHRGFSIESLPALKIQGYRSPRFFVWRES